MSAPASLAIAKTLFPETKKTRADWNAIANVKAKYFAHVFISLTRLNWIRLIFCIFMTWAIKNVFKACFQLYYMHLNFHEDVA